MRSGSLVKSSPSPGCSTVRPAETTLFKSPYSHSRHAATLPKLPSAQQQRKAAPRQVSDGLITAVRNELERENIDLTHAPYSSKVSVKVVEKKNANYIWLQRL